MSTTGENTVRRELLHIEGGSDLGVDASDLGWRPGEWAETVLVPDRFGRLLRFERLQVVRDREGDVSWVAYTLTDHISRCTLRVYND